MSQRPRFYWMIHEISLWEDQKINIGPGLRFAKYMQMTQGVEKGSIGFLPIFEIREDAMKVARDQSNVVEIIAWEDDAVDPDEQIRLDNVGETKP